MAETSHGDRRADASMRRGATCRRRPGVFIALVLIVVVFEVLGRLLMGDSFLFNTRENVDGIFNDGAAADHHPAGLDHRHHRPRRDPGDHHRRHRPVLRLDRRRHRDDRHELRPGQRDQRAREHARGLLRAGLVDLPVILPIVVALACGLVAGLINGLLIAYTGIPPFIATLGMMVTARGVAKWWTARPAGLVSRPTATPRSARA